MNDISKLSLDANTSHQNVVHPGLVDGSDGTDAIHCSALTDFIGAFDEVRSGSEDALDLNNQCRRVKMSARLWNLQGRIGITIKGGSTDIEVSGPVQGSGMVELGGWSDQSHERTERVRLNLAHVEGRSIPVRVLLADEPVLTNGPYHYLFPSPHNPLHSFFVWGFMTLRRLGLFR